MGAFGDVPGLRRAATDLKRLAGELDGLRARLGSVQGELAGRWRGEAYDRFDQRVGEYRRDLDHLAGDAAAAGQVLAFLAEELERAGQAASRARERAAAAGLPVGDPGWQPQCLPDPALDEARRAYEAELAAARGHAEAAWAAAERQLAALHPETSPLAMTLLVVGNAEKLRGIGTARYDAITGSQGMQARLQRAYQQVLAEHKAAPRHRVSRAEWQAKLEQARRAKAASLRADRLLDELDAGGSVVGRALSWEVQRLGPLGPLFRSPVLKPVGRLPVIGVFAAGAGTAADVRSGQAGVGEALVGNFGGLAASTAAGLGTGALIAAAPVSVPVVATVGAVAVVSYGVGTAVHSLVTRGDLSEFKDDWNTVKNVVTSWFD